MNDHQKRILDNAIRRISNNENVKILSFRRTDENYNGKNFHNPPIKRFYNKIAVVGVGGFEIIIKYEGENFSSFKRDYVDWGLKILNNHGKLEEILNLSLL